MPASHTRPQQHTPSYNPGIPPDLATLEPNTLIEIADSSASRFAQIDQLKTNQLRNVFAHIIEMRTDYRQALVDGGGTLGDAAIEALKRKLILLKPKLAYAKGRKSKELSNFYTFMIQAIDATVNSKSNIQQAFENFFVLMEALVAYHKFYGGKD